MSGELIADLIDMCRDLELDHVLHHVVAKRIDDQLERQTHNLINQSRPDTYIKTDRQLNVSWIFLCKTKSMKVLLFLRRSIEATLNDATTMTVRTHFNTILGD